MNYVLTFENWRTIQESEGHLYSTEERLNEGLSDFFHSVGDFASIVADLVVPGSGAVIDFINGLAYFIESLALEDEIEATSAAVSGLITFGSMALPAVLQTIATEAKGLLNRVVKGLQKAASKVDLDEARTAAAKVAEFLLGFINNISSISSKIVSKAKELFSTDVGKFIKDKIGGSDKLPAWISSFFNTVKGWFQKLVNKINEVFPKAEATTTKLTGQNIAQEYTKNTVKGGITEEALRIGKAVLLSAYPYTNKTQLGSAAESTAVDIKIDPKKVELPGDKIGVKRTIQGSSLNKKVDVTTVQNRPTTISRLSQNKAPASVGTPFYDAKTKKLKYTTMNSGDIKQFDVEASFVYPNIKDGKYPEVADEDKFRAGESLKKTKGR